MSSRWLIGLLVVLLFLLQFQLWLGEHSLPRLWKLEGEIAAQRDRNADQEAQNAALRDEVRALKTDPEVIEEYAREELGMIKRGERFILITEE